MCPSSSPVRRYGEEYLAAEAEAKAGKRGLWASYVEPEPAAVSEEPSGDELVTVRVCEVVDGKTFFVHAAVDDGKVLVCLCVCVCICEGRVCA